MKITVTQEMIDRFPELHKSYSRHCCCPISQAVMEAFGITEFGKVGTDFFGIRIGSDTKFKITTKMEHFLCDFDFDRKAKPTTFQLRKIK